MFRESPPLKPVASTLESAAVAVAGEHSSATSCGVAKTREDECGGVGGGRPSSQEALSTTAKTMVLVANKDVVGVVASGIC